MTDLSFCCEISLNVAVESKVGFYTTLQCFRAPLWIMFLACIIRSAEIYGLSLLYTCSGRVFIHQDGTQDRFCSCVAPGRKGVTKLEDHRCFWTEEVVGSVGWWILLLGKSRKYKQKHWNVKIRFLNKTEMLHILCLLLNYYLYLFCSLLYL